MHKKVVIIGSGPAGYTAAIYAARAMLDPLMITGQFYGGQLMTTTDVENFPGYVDGIMGPKLMEDLHNQAERFGTTFEVSDVKTIDTKQTPFVINTDNGKQIEADAIIISTGARAIWLGLEGEEKLRSNGVSTCATCDGAFYKGSDLILVGGGDSAMEEAVFLTRYANKVTIIHRREEFRASKIMLDRAKGNDKIEFIVNTRVEKWLTDDKGALTGAKIVNTVDGTESEINCQGAFIAIGHKPTTDFLNNQIELDNNGYILHKEHTMTSVPGIFACGDVVDTRYKQAITAAGQGCQAAIDCTQWLEEKK